MLLNAGQPDQDPATGEWYQDEASTAGHPAGQASGPSAFKGISSLGAYGAKKQAEAEKVGRGRFCIGRFLSYNSIACTFPSGRGLTWNMYGSYYS